MLTTENKIEFVTPIISTEEELKALLDNFKPKSTFILADENTVKLISVIADMSPMIKDAEIIEIKSGEKNKNLEVCHNIWQHLSNNQCKSKKALNNKP